MNSRAWKEWFLYMGKVITAAVAVLFLLLIISFKTGVRDICCKSPSGPVSGNIKVAATFFPVYDIANRIGGGRIDVALVLPPGASPHTFELTPERVKDITGSQVIFKIGGVDDWVDSVGESIGAEKVVLNKGIDIRDYHVLSIGDEEEEGSGDPHYWLTMENSKIIAGQIAGKMAELDPEGAAYFSENLEDFKKEADAADGEMKNILAPYAGRKFIAFHNAWSYFAEEYGLEVVASFEPAPGKEPSLTYLKDLSDLVKREDIRVIFSEPSFSDASVRAFVSDFGIDLVVLYPESGPSSDYSFTETMVENARIIAGALSK